MTIEEYVTCKRKIIGAIYPQFEAVYVGLMHLRILGIVNNHMRHFQTGVDTMQFYLSTANLRLMRFRDKATVYYSYAIPGGEGPEKMHSLFVAANIRHGEQLSDPIMFTSYDYIRAAGTVMEHQADISFDEARRYYRLVDGILNHIQ